ncbi:MAG: phage tail protein, partial [Alphaproteobacteria bacterium]|nr:phage tail protein [Alphaproteobacteria bacterium]
SETQTTFMSNGSPRKVTFNLKLKRYGEDNRKGGMR